MKCVIRWLFSLKVRRALAYHNHVKRLLAAQRDILPEPSVTQLKDALQKLLTAIKRGDPPATVEGLKQELEVVAGTHLKPYPNPRIRENIEVILVAITLALGIRTFFIQPFKIPTGSMQPTLWGITSWNVINDPTFKIPTGLQRLVHWLHGTNYVHLVSKTDGYLEEITPPWPPVIFSVFQRIKIGGQWHYIWFPPDYGAPPFGTLEARAGLKIGQYFRKGQDVVKLVIKKGDHLFVDRFTYNFRRPKRGEIIVFETWGFDPNLRYAYRVPPDQFYIKRLVGLGSETISIGNDHHVRINGRRLDASTPHFEFLYTFSADAPPDQYFGHIPMGLLSAGVEFKIPPNHYYVLGDNTRNSLDSRFLGPIPQECVIGKAWFIYWPLSERFGLGYR